ncbi:unnamed protein product [Euphydryas editha]|nr:unnamed protein product [Euphydryas editha]
MVEAADKNKARFDRGRAKIQQFQRGDYVLIKKNPRNQTSLDPKYSVPYEIHKVIKNDRYLVKKVIGYHGRSRKVAHDQLRRAPQPGVIRDKMTVSPSDDQLAGPSGIDQTSTVTQQSIDNNSLLPLPLSTDEQNIEPSEVGQVPAHTTNANNSTSEMLSSTE